MKVSNDECIALIRDLKSCLYFDRRYNAINDITYDKGMEAIELLDRIFSEMPKVIVSPDHIEEKCQI